MECGVVNLLKLKFGEKGKVWKSLLGGPGHTYKYWNCLYSHRKRYSWNGSQGKGCKEIMFKAFDVYQRQVLKALENRKYECAILKVGDVCFVVRQCQAGRIVLTCLREGGEILKPSDFGP